LISVFVEGIGLVGPGLQGWSASRPVLSGEEPYRPAALSVAPNDLLPASERRRAGVPVKLALAVAREVFEHASRDPASTATVFTSSSGDGENVHQIFETLATDERQISPTRFHNSVHNAAAGYWSIATQSRAPSTSLCGYDDSFAAGLLDAGAQVSAELVPAALVAYDQPYPQPLHAKRPLAGSFAVALLITHSATPRAFARVDLALTTGAEPTTELDDPGLERLRVGVPAARSLPLLAALARNSTGFIRLQHGAGQMELNVTPCR
jgi:hypothetical protein